VVIDETLERVDETATLKLRVELKKQRLRAGD
jgi:hypothetical protein